MMTDRPPDALPVETAVLTPDSWTEPFWVAAAEHRLVIPRCTHCGLFRMPPSPFCYSCRAQDVEWVEQDGTGVVYSFTVVHHAVTPIVANAVPYVPAVIELPDAPGVRLVVQLVGVDPKDVRIGMRVRVVWDDVGDGVAIPRFTAV
jgi:uncharacterized OB-fold protein